MGTKLLLENEDRRETDQKRRKRKKVIKRKEANAMNQSGMEISNISNLDELTSGKIC